MKIKVYDGSVHTVVSKNNKNFVLVEIEEGWALNDYRKKWLKKQNLLNNKMEEGKKYWIYSEDMYEVISGSKLELE